MNQQVVYLVCHNDNYGNVMRRIFGVPRERVITKPDFLRGSREDVVLFCYDGPWDSKTYIEFKEMFEMCRHTVINVPEIAAVSR